VKRGTRRALARSIRRAFSARLSERYYVRSILLVSLIFGLTILNLTGVGVASGNPDLERSPLFVQWNHTRHQTPLGDLAFGKHPPILECAGERAVNGVAYVDGKAVKNTRLYGDNYLGTTKGVDKC